MILIVSDNIGMTLVDYRGRIKRLSRCRLTGTLGGVKVRIIPRHTLENSLMGSRPIRVIFDNISPSEKELDLVKMSLAKVEY